MEMLRRKQIRATVKNSQPFLPTFSGYENQGDDKKEKSKGRSLTPRFSKAGHATHTCATFVRSFMEPINAEDKSI